MKPQPSTPELMEANEFAQVRLKAAIREWRLKAKIRSAKLRSRLRIEDKVKGLKRSCADIDAEVVMSMFKWEIRINWIRGELDKREAEYECLTRKHWKEVKGL